MPDVQEFDHIVTDSKENLVGISADEQDFDVWIVCPVAAVRLFGHPQDCGA